jgi:uncharacterized coiled-coil protein SlyX
MTEDERIAALEDDVANLQRDLRTLYQAMNQLFSKANESTDLRQTPTGYAMAKLGSHN